MVKHGETFSVTIRRHSEKYNSRRAEQWTKQLAEACTALLGSDPSGLAEEFPVHVVSSNTHSVGNCLTSWYTEQMDAMTSWVEKDGHPFAANRWSNRYDLLYAVARDYFIAHPDEARAAVEAELKQGIVRLKETASTGIQVQLIDADRVCRSSVDPAVSACGTGAPGLIVNIDYAFGEQAEHILRHHLVISIVYGIAIGQTPDFINYIIHILICTGLFQDIEQIAESTLVARKRVKCQVRYRVNIQDDIIINKIIIDGERQKGGVAVDCCKRAA